MKEEIKKAYLVQVVKGQYEDYNECNKFTTNDIEVSGKWVRKYNKIIDENRERIKSFQNNMEFDEDGEYDGKHPFWYDEIGWDKPFARFLEIEQR